MFSTMPIPIATAARIACRTAVRYRHPVLALFGVLVLSLPVAAATYTVNTTSDAVGASGISLREAITAANTNAAFGGAGAGSSDGDVINFSVSGTITLTNGELVITDDVTINATGITIDGNDASRLFTFDAAGSPGSVDEITINGGLFTSGAAGSANGGAILMLSGTATVDGVTFSSNTAFGGGAIEQAGPAGSVLSSVDCDYFGNTASINGGALHVLGAGTLAVSGGNLGLNVANQEGGGIWNSATGTVTVSGTTISLNSATAANAPNDAQGGGGLFNNGGTMTITGATISSNSVTGTLGPDDGGGGIFNDGRNAPGSLTVIDTTISNNTVSVTNGNGGGILSIGAPLGQPTTQVLGGEITGNMVNRAGGGVESNNSQTSLHNVLVSSNTAGLNGAGVHATGADVVEIVGGSILGNVAMQEGGGVWNGATSTMTITGTLISGNTAQCAGAALDAQGGGGLFNNGGTVQVSNATITTNTVTGTVDSQDGGGGIFNDGRNASGAQVLLRDTVVSGNTALTTNGNGGGILTIGTSGNRPITDIAGGAVIGNQALRAGGGIESNNAVLHLDQVVVDGNTTGVNGGGVHLTGGDQASILDSFVTGNTAMQEGGGVWNGATSAMTITGSLISDNTAQTANDVDAQGGGGVFNNGGTMQITSSTISSNTVTGADDGVDGGGGIFSDGRSTGGTVTVTDSVVSGNTALGTEGNGGGLLVIGGMSTTPTLRVTNSSVNDNEAARRGGGIESNRSILRLTNVSVENNTAGLNGGGVHTQSPGGDTIIAGGRIRGNSAEQEGGGVWNYAASTMAIDGTVITNNVARTANAAADAQGGGGIFNNGGTVTITNGTISANRAEGALGTDDGGGGIFNDGRNTAGSVVLSNSLLSNNLATDGTGYGGGIFMVGQGTNVPSFEITNSDVRGNRASYYGGGIASTTAILTIEESSLLNNSAYYGGGGVAALGVLVLGPGTRLRGNTSQVNGGGAAFYGGFSDLDLQISLALFESNVAGGLGGGLYVNSLTSFSIEGTSFAENIADTGGGTYLTVSATTPSQISNSTFTRNGAANAVGGLAAVGQFELIHATVHENIGGGVGTAGGTLTLLNSAVTHGAATGSDCIGGGVVASGANFDSDGTCGASLSGDPMLGPPGSDFYLVPHPLSPLVDQADNGPCLAAPVSGLDQRQVSRPIGPACDIGAAEAGLPIFVDGFESGDTSAWSASVG